MKRLFLLILLLWVSSCSLPDSDYTFNPYNHYDKTFESVQELSDFVNEYVTYKSDPRDGKDHWQHPNTTYKLKTGDCEDIAILKMRWVYYYFGLQGEVYAVMNKDSAGHAVFVLDGLFYDGQACTYDEYMKDCNLFAVYSFSEALDKCNLHESEGR